MSFYEIEEYVTASGKNKISDFVNELHKKHNVNDIILLERLKSDLKERGFDQRNPNIVKPLDKTLRIYEIKRKGKELRVGIYAARDSTNGKILILGAFLKDSQKTRKVELELLRSRLKDYLKRKENKENER